jgi:hypothetical protein
MPSDRVRQAEAHVLSDKYRAVLLRMLEGSLVAGETVVAVLPFVTTRKRPKSPGAPRGKAGKVRTGIYQSWRRYRPLVLTDRRLFVFETGHTPNPRAVLAQFALSDLEVVSVTTNRSSTSFVLEIPAVGRVPFDAGRREQRDAAILVASLGMTLP